MVILQSANKIVLNPESDYDIYRIGRMSKKFRTFEIYYVDLPSQCDKKPIKCCTINAHEFINVIADIVPDAK